jgi:hypothetical protein
MSIGVDYDIYILSKPQYLRGCFNFEYFEHFEHFELLF